MAVTLAVVLSTGIDLAQRFLYLLGLTTGVSVVWIWVSLRSMEVTVERLTRRIRVGENIDERITVRNASLLPKPLIEIQDLTDLPGYSNGRAVSLPSKGSRRWRTLTPARKRGVYKMGPVRLSTTDPFGLFSREKLMGGTTSLIVYPRTFELTGFAIRGSYMSGESTSRKRTQDVTPHAGSIREYAFGDSISRVHWKSTAKLGRLMSKEFDLGQSSDVWLIVDLYRNVQAGELEESTDEYAVSIAASLARTYLEAQLPLGLIAYGDQRYFLPAETGTGQFDRVLEFLAMSRAEGAVPLVTALANEDALWGYKSTVIVITSSNRGDWVRALRELSKRRVQVAVILLDATSFGGYHETLDVVPELYAAGHPPYLVRRGDSIPVALKRPYTLRDSEAPTELEEVASRV